MRTSSAFVYWQYGMQGVPDLACCVLACREEQCCQCMAGHVSPDSAVCHPCAGGYVCGEGFLNGQLTVTRGLGDFHPDALGAQRARERLKYRASPDAEPLQLCGPLTSGVCGPVSAGLWCIGRLYCTQMRLKEQMLWTVRGLLI